MSSTASKVADIFTAAGAAFNRLGELTVQLHPLTSDGSAQTSGKWGNAEIEMLQNAVQRFGEDLKKISEIITTKSMTQIKSALKQRMYEQNESNSPKKTPQKRSRNNIETSTEKSEEVAKKIKQEPEEASTSSEKTATPSKDAENEVDVESVEEVAGQNHAQNASTDGYTASQVTSSEIATS